MIIEDFGERSNHCKCPIMGNVRGILEILGKIIETESIAKYILLLVVKQYNRLSQPPHILFNYSGFKDSPTHNYLSDNIQVIFQNLLEVQESFIHLPWTRFLR